MSSGMSIESKRAFDNRSVILLPGSLITVTWPPGRWAVFVYALLHVE
jgi:hypothetical protein